MEGNDSQIAQNNPEPQLNPIENVPLPEPKIIETPRFLLAVSDDEYQPEPMQELRKSIEGCIKSIMSARAETQTDPEREDETTETPRDSEIANQEEQLEETPRDDDLDKQQSPREETPRNDKLGNQDASETQEDETPRNEEDADFSRVLITEVDKAVEGKTHPIVIPALNFNEIPPEDIPEDVEEEEEEVEEECEPEIPTYTQEDLAAAFKEFQKRKVLPPIDMKEFVITYAKALCYQAIEDEDYDLAQKVEVDLKSLIKAYKSCARSDTMQNQSVNLESRLSEVKEKEQLSKIEWEQRIVDLKEREQAKLVEIEKKQQQEREEFEAKCQTPEFLQRFTKPSPMLLQLWKLQKGLALQHDFEAAKGVKQRADELQKKETIEAQKRAMKSVQQNYEKLLQKQKREIDCARANGVRKIKQMEVEMTKDREVKAKLNRQVETRMKDRRPPLQRSFLPRLGGAREAVTAVPSKRAVSRVRNVEAPTQALEVKIPSIKSVLGTRAKPFV